MNESVSQQVIRSQTSWKSACFSNTRNDYSSFQQSPTGWWLFLREKVQYSTFNTVNKHWKISKWTHSTVCMCMYVCVEPCRATSLGMNLFRPLSLFPNQLSHGCHMHSFMLPLPASAVSLSPSLSFAISLCLTHTKHPMSNPLCL